jgi:hypothetical protein
VNQIERLLNIAESEDERKALFNLIDLLAELIGSDKTRIGRKKLFDEITKYLEKKRAPRASTIEDELDYLRYVRNALAHRKAIPDEAIRVAIPMFWRALKGAAVDWEWHELSHLLSYAMHLKEPLPIAVNALSSSRIKKYEDRFNKTDPDERVSVFRDLLLRIYDTYEFQKHVKKSRSTVRNGGGLG